MDKQNINEGDPDVELLIEHMSHGFANCRMQYENDCPCDFTYLMFIRCYGLRWEQNIGTKQHKGQ